MQQKIGTLSVLYGLYRVPIFCYYFCLIESGDDNDGILTQENENKEYITGNTSLFFVLHWGQDQKGTDCYIIMWPPGVAFVILFQ